MTKPTIGAQITALEHAIAVLRADEEMSPALAGVLETLKWIERNADLIRLCVDMRKLAPNAAELAAEFVALSRDNPTVLDAMRAFKGARIVMHETEGAGHGA